jgi:hypothetical protein
METSDLIRVLSADAGRRQAPQSRVWVMVLLVAVVIAAAVFFLLLGPRPDIAEAARTVDFLFKFVVTGLLAVTAVPLLFALSRPEGGHRHLVWLAAAPTALLIALAIELAMFPSAEWATRLIGVNSPECIYFIVAIGAVPLALFMTALGNAAPTRPTLSGFIAGLAAGGIAATLYAAHCTDDSPLFVAVWYVGAVAILALLGALVGRIFIRW